MNQIEEVRRLLIAASYQLVMLSEDKKLDMDTCIHCEHMSHDTYKMSNDLKNIKQSYGV